ncbi:hypothetical protein LTR84_009408 [Exophiala bonariae]|uniref:BolA protein n=1 Tax=Exophiala bonariae TaxID=1690606 RepID=A0AAV9MY83_9EURO|nr:hypothetical protein LTR84_009408 [Exophiala bonariae]
MSSTTIQSASGTPLADSIRRKVRLHVTAYSMLLGIVLSTVVLCQSDKICELQVEAAFNPVNLTIKNNSADHQHHSAMRGVESKETHFELEVITPAFQGKSQVKRHREIYDLLAAEMAPGLVHALQLHTRTPEEDERYRAREQAKQEAAAPR